MEKKFEEMYEELKEKYELPSFNEINKDFEIYSISKDEDIIREILKKMSGAIDYYIGFLEDIIQPDSRFYTLKEANVLDVNQRKKVHEIYAKLMFLNRTFNELYLSYSEERGVELIKKIFTEWQPLKMELLEIIRPLKDSWSKHTEIKPDKGYFG